MNRDDKAIKQDIVEHLAWDARVNATNIDVQVETGNVRLTGTAVTYGERMTAYEDAWSVPGVISVDNQIVVTLPDDYARLGDDDIRVNINRIIELHPLIDTANIDVRVAGGYVELHGTLDAYWKKQRVENMIADIRGVIDINNNLSIEPEQKTADGSIAEMVQTALARNAQVDADQIEVMVEDGLVTLSGVVPNWGVYREAYQSALYTDGVLGILDELTIRTAS